MQVNVAPFSSSIKPFIVCIVINSNQTTKTDVQCQNKYNIKNCQESASIYI